MSFYIKKVFRVLACLKTTPLVFDFNDLGNALRHCVIVVVSCCGILSCVSRGWGNRE